MTFKKNIRACSGLEGRPPLSPRKGVEWADEY